MSLVGQVLCQRMAMGVWATWMVGRATAAAAPVAPTAAFLRKLRREAFTASRLAAAMGFLLFMLGSLGRQASRLADDEVASPLIRTRNPRPPIPGAARRDPSSRTRVWSASLSPPGRDPNRPHPPGERAAARQEKTAGPDGPTPWARRASDPVYFAGAFSACFSSCFAAWATSWWAFLCRTFLAVAG